MDANSKHYVELWMKQSQLFWQTVYQVPVIAGAMFAGWFALKSATQDALAQGLLVVGVLSMAVQVLILKRMAQYLNTFRQAADRLIPSVPPAFVGLTGYVLGTIVPVLIACFFVALLIWSPEFKAATSQSAASATTWSSPAVVPAKATAAVTAPTSSPASVPNPLLKGTSAGKPAAAP